MTAIRQGRGPRHFSDGDRREQKTTKSRRSAAAWRLFGTMPSRCTNSLACVFARWKAPQKCATHRLAPSSGFSTVCAGSSELLKRRSCGGIAAVPAAAPTGQHKRRIYLPHNQNSTPPSFVKFHRRHTRHFLWSYFDTSNDSSPQY